MSDDLVIDSQGGAKINDIPVKLKNVKERKYCDITVVCGTNDTITKRPLQKVHNGIKNLIDQAKKKAVNVKLSSIPPRTDGMVDSTRTDMINDIISKQAIESDVTFISNDTNF